MCSIKQDERSVHWCRRCSFHGWTSVTVQSWWVWSDIITHIIITIILISQCSFSSNKCGRVADKKNHHHSHKTAPIYICNNKNPAKSHTELHYSRKPCWYDFVDNTISGTFIWNNWSHVQFVLNCNKHFRFLLDKHSLLSERVKVIFSMYFFTQLFFAFQIISKLAWKNNHEWSIVRTNFRQKCLRQE